MKRSIWRGNSFPSAPTWMQCMSLHEDRDLDNLIPSWMSLRPANIPVLGRGRMYRESKVLVTSPFLFSEDLPTTGIETGSPTLQADPLPSEPPGKHLCFFKGSFPPAVTPPATRGLTLGSQHVWSNQPEEEGSPLLEPRFPLEPLFPDKKQCFKNGSKLGEKLR